ncbi:CHASE3 domain-containing protein [soil metagenome]
MAVRKGLRVEWVPVAFAVVLAVILTAAFATWGNARQVPEATDRVLHTLKVEENIQVTEAAMLRTETTHRAYVLTGSPEILTQFNELLNEDTEAISALTSLTNDNPIQIKNVDSLRSIWTNKEKEMQEVVRLRAEKGLSAGAQRVGQGYGLQLMSQAREVLQRMREEETTLLAQRNAATESARQRAVISFVLSTAIGVALLVGLAILFTRFTVQEAKNREIEQRHAEVLRQEIAERERARQSEARLLEELQRSNRELQDFAFVASHDLQEPLRKIIAFGDRVKRRESATMTPEGADYLQRAINAADRMQGLINSLLDFSRVTSQAKPFAPTDLNRVMRDVTEDLQARIERTSGTVNVSSLPTLDADITQMRQLFQNLVGNALKFAKPGQPPIVEVNAESLPGGRWRLRVADNGIGFDQKYADKVFTIFQRLHGRGEYEGNGIGLAIVRKIVERHGGTISATSQSGEGATFEVILPAKQSNTKDL